MTDKEIIKCLRHCRAGDCEECKALGVCNATFSFHKNALDLINRQKEEIERLENENKILSKNADTAFQDGLNEAQDLYAEQIKAEIKSEAIKEFAERLKEKIRSEDDCEYHCFDCCYECRDYVQAVDNLVEEMTEVEK